MKRLTERLENGVINVKYASQHESAIHRLVTIEDILGDEYDLDRLRELVQADREGRCVVLPSVEYTEEDGEIEREALLKAMITSDERINLFQAGIASARAVVASAPTADVTSVEWIRADERLPDDERDGETVLAIVSGKPHENITLCQAIMLAGYFGEDGWLVNEYPEWENPVVTHWMPLPELPKNK